MQPVLSEISIPSHSKSSHDCSACGRSAECADYWCQSALRVPSDATHICGRLPNLITPLDTHEVRPAKVPRGERSAAMDPLAVWADVVLMVFAVVFMGLL